MAKNLSITEYTILVNILPLVNMRPLFCWSHSPSWYTSHTWLSGQENRTGHLRSEALVVASLHERLPSHCCILALSPIS